MYIYSVHNNINNGTTCTHIYMTQHILLYYYIMLQYNIINRYTCVHTLRYKTNVHNAMQFIHYYIITALSAPKIN